MIDWAKLIRNYRREKRLTQISFSEILGVDQATVSRWERGSQVPDIPTQSKVLSMVFPDHGALLSLIQAVRYAHGYMSVIRHDGIVLAMSQAMTAVAAQFIGHIGPEGFPYLSLNEPEEKWGIQQIFCEDNLWGIGIAAGHAVWRHYTTNTYWCGSIHPLHLDGSMVLLTITEPASTTQYRDGPSMRIFYKDGRVEDKKYHGGC